MKPAAAETWEARPDPDVGCRITLRRTTSPVPATSQKLLVHVTKVGRKVTAILSFYSYYECTGIPNIRLYNGTQYKVFNPVDGLTDVYYDPSKPPMHTNFEIKLRTGRGNSPTKSIAKTEKKGSPKQVPLRFDACAAINAYHSSRGGYDGNKVKRKSISISARKPAGAVNAFLGLCVIWATWKNNTNNSVYLVKERDTILGSNVPCVSGHCNPVELIFTNP
ncbi:hypothetical protein AAY473_017811 [Plecturocebus cupreus]